MHENRIYQYRSVKRAVKHNLPLHLHTPQSWTLNHVHFCSGYLISSFCKPLLGVVPESLRFSPCDDPHKVKCFLTPEGNFELKDKIKHG